MTGMTEIDFHFVALMQSSQADSYGIATLGECINCAVNFAISGPEYNYQDQHVSIIKWRLQTGTRHVLRVNPGT